MSIMVVTPSDFVKIGLAVYV